MGWGGGSRPARCVDGGCCVEGCGGLRAVRRCGRRRGRLHGCPEPSFCGMRVCGGRAPPLGAGGAGGVLVAIAAPGPAVAVAVKLTGLPVMPLPAALAVSVLGPAVVPRVHEVKAAIPPAPVVTGVVGLTLPLPAVGANVTATPATGLLN